VFFFLKKKKQKKILNSNCNIFSIWFFKKIKNRQDFQKLKPSNNLVEVLRSSLVEDRV
jgi:hypothetical protein